MIEQVHTKASPAVTQQPRVREHTPFEPGRIKLKLPLLSYDRWSLNKKGRALVGNFFRANTHIERRRRQPGEQQRLGGARRGAVAAIGVEDTCAQLHQPRPDTARTFGSLVNLRGIDKIAQRGKAYIWVLHLFKNALTALTWRDSA
ncbi:hypothetical protein HC891_05165 [Candidatus Gracilibacteria bacterium]|nr:hypothetical protein [Candidatus Gracilibacteria bacterium]